MALCFEFVVICTALRLFVQLDGVHSQTTSTTSTSMLINTSTAVNGTFPCTGNNGRFDLTDLCDGVARCPLQDDEFMCDVEGVCSSDRIRCLNSESRCIPFRLICDDDDDCSDGSDEYFCEQVNCSNNCYCSPIKAICRQQGGAMIDELEISSAIRFLTFYGELVGNSRLPEGLPFNMTRFSLLLELTIHETGLTAILAEDMKDISGIKELTLSDNNIREIETLAFKTMTHLRTLYLSNNLISILERNMFAGLINLEELDLSGNRISNLEPGVFDALTNLQNLVLKSNLITVLHTATFSNLSLLQLSLVPNPIQRIETGAFYGASGVTDLNIARLPNLTVIEAGAFRGMNELSNLVLYGNGLTRIPSGIFSGIEDTLRYLHLFDCNISTVDADAFKGLTILEHLDMTNNSMKAVKKGIFADLINVEWLSLSDNPLEYIEAGAFENMTSLKFINIVNVKLDNLQPDTFRGITSLEGLSTDDYRLCCLFNNAELCSIAASTSLDSCARLMPNSILRVALWLIGFGALIGNGMVLFIRGREEITKKGTPQRFFITNLAVADFLMGVYMILIASADIYYGEYYYLYGPTWRESQLCKFAGFIAVLSSESSVFILTLITVDRFLCVIFPFGKLRFHSTTARFSAAAIWILTFILSLGPILLSSYVSGFYGLSDVCVGLPLNVDSTGTGTLQYSYEKRIYEYVPAQTGQRPSWVYSIVLFLAINLFLFMIICVSYVIIFIQVKRSAKGLTSGRTSEQAKEIKLAARMALVVGTDFCCWMPVILMGILSQSGLVQLPVSLYAWSVVFILPINASLNPYLYTFVAFTERKKKHKQSQYLRSGNTMHSTTM